jgi:hypothetical protein
MNRLLFNSPKNGLRKASDISVDASITPATQIFVFEKTTCEHGQSIACAGTRLYIELVVLTNVKSSCASVFMMESSPFRSRMVRRVEVNDLSPFMTQNDKDIQDSEGCSGDGEEVYRCQLRYMIIKETTPGLRCRLPMADHVFGDRGFGQTYAKHFQFTMDAGRAVAGAPQPMLFRDMVRISSRTSGSIAGRPPRRRRDFQIQYKRNPLRCQRTGVSGLKISNV